MKIAETTVTSTERRFKRGDRVRLLDVRDLDEFNLEPGDVGVVRGYCRDDEWTPGERAVKVDFGLQGLTYDGCPAEKDGVVFVAEAHIEPVTCAAPRYTRLAALDTISRLYQRRCRSRRAGELWRRLEKLLDGGEAKGR